MGYTDDKLDALLKGMKSAISLFPEESLRLPTIKRCSEPIFLKSSGVARAFQTACKIIKDTHESQITSLETQEKTR